MKDLKLWVKIALGFGSLIVIVLILGGTAVWKMKAVEKQSVILAKEFVPEIEYLNEVERLVHKAMFEIRGYALSRKNHYLDEGRADIDKIKVNTDKIKKLADVSPHLKNLKKAITKVETDILAYEDLVNKTAEVNDNISRIKDLLDEQAAVYMGNSYDYLSSQVELMEEEIQQGVSKDKLETRFSKINLINEVITMGNSIRAINSKAEAERDTEAMESALENFSLIDETFEDLKSMTKNAERDEIIENVKKASSLYNENMKALISNWHILNELTKQRGVASANVIKIAQETAEKGMISTKNIVDNTMSSLSAASVLMIVGLIVAMILATGIAVFMTIAITGPIAKGVRFAKVMSEGDFTETLDINQKDEIGILSDALNEMSSVLRGMFSDISKSVHSLSTSSSELSQISSMMSSGAEQTSAKSDTLANSADEVNSNMVSLAAAMEEASTNTNVVASAAEEMTATISEIAKNTETARVIADKASSQSDITTNRVNELGKAAQEIGKVTETINDISEQTNLLALNATIEAARAGEAGKGFAVVANEIKELARQTADATSEIKAEIESIQNSTVTTVDEIVQISSIIKDLNEIVSTIATAVEEQSVTTNEIAMNISQASQGISDVTERVSDSSHVIESISNDIGEVNRASGEMSDNSSQVNLSADNLSVLADELKAMVDKFKV